MNTIPAVAGLAFIVAMSIAPHAAWLPRIYARYCAAAGTGLACHLEDCRCADARCAPRSPSLRRNPVRLLRKAADMGNLQRNASWLFPLNNDPLRFAAGIPV